MTELLITCYSKCALNRFIHLERSDHILTFAAFVFTPSAFVHKDQEFNSLFIQAQRGCFFRFDHYFVDWNLLKWVWRIFPPQTWRTVFPLTVTDWCVNDTEIIVRKISGWEILDKFKNACVFEYHVCHVRFLWLIRSDVVRISTSSTLKPVLLCVLVLTW